MSIPEAQRKELASFLRSRRERVTPKEAGIQNSYGRRRTPGLRREEVALLANVSVTWYTWLEQGRRIRVSQDVLDGLAQALLLDETETDHLYQLAGETRPARRTPCVKEDLPEQYLAFLESIDPMPGFISNHRFDVLACNYGYRVLFPQFDSLSASDKNSLIMAFNPDFGALYPDLDEHRLEAVALFRAQVADQLAYPEYSTLVRRLQQESDAFRHLWERRDLAPASPSLRTFDHPVLGRIELGYVKLKLADVDATLVVFQPLHDNQLLTAFGDLVEDRIRSQLHSRTGRFLIDPVAEETSSTTARRLPEFRSRSPAVPRERDGKCSAGPTLLSPAEVSGSFP